MTITYEKIATNTLTSNQSSITFSSITSTYTDLVIVVDGFSTAGGEFRCRFNSDSGTNYSWIQLYGDGSTAGTSISNNQSYGRLGSTRTTQNSIIVDIANYSNSTTFKTAISRDGNGSVIINTITSLWRSTSAINSIQFFPETGAFNTGMVFTIYGIKAE